MAVHPDSIVVAAVAREHDAPVIDLGTIGTRQADSEHLLRLRHAQAQPLVFGYDAGPCGAWLSRSLCKTGDVCWGVAPSLSPKQAGDRVNTDRRDAVPLARVRRSGDLTPVYVPTVEDEDLRELGRAREEASGDLQTAQCRLNACLLRHDLRDTGQAPGGPAHFRWLSDVVCPTPAQPMVFHEDVRAVTAHTARLQRLEQARHAHVQAWRLPPVVEALPALRGLPLTVAVTTVAEAESSRGERRRPGASTKAGTTPARRALLEGAWAYRYPAQVSRHMSLRLATLPNPMQAFSWKAPGQLCNRVRCVMARGQHANQVVVAMARALGGACGPWSARSP